MQLIAENEALFDRVGHSDRELDRIESHLAEIQHLQYIFAEKVCTAHLYRVKRVEVMDADNRLGNLWNTLTGK